MPGAKRSRRNRKKKPEKRINEIGWLIFSIISMVAFLWPPFADLVRRIWQDCSSALTILSAAW